MGTNRDNDAVDSILEELKNKARPPMQREGGADLDDILAQIGRSKPAAAPHTQQQAPAPQAEPLRQPRRHFEDPPPEEGAYDPRAFAAAKAQRQVRQEEPTRVSAAVQAEKPPRPGVEAGKTAIWDIHVESSPAGPRLGKAAALDRVDPDKFTGDTELLSWFSGEGEEPLSKKEQRRLEKESKKQEAAARRQQRAPKKQRGYQEGQEDDMAEDTGLFREQQEEAEAAAPFLQEDAPFSGESYAWEQETAVAPPLWPAGPQPSQNFMEGPGSYFANDGEGFFASRPAQPQQEEPPARKEERATPDETIVGGSAFDTAWESSDWTQAEKMFDTLHDAGKQDAPHDTQTYDLEEDGEGHYPKVPTAAFTQEFGEQDQNAVANGTATSKNLYVEEMVDDKFREFFRETVSVNPEEEAATKRQKRLRKKRGQLLTGEFAKLGIQAEEESRLPEEEDYEEYNHPQDAPAIEKSIYSLQALLLRRTIINGVLGVLLLWLGLGAAEVLPLPGFVSPAGSPLAFGLVYLALVLFMVVLNFSVVAPGLVGLAGEATVDSSPALAAVGALLQAVVILVQLMADGTVAVTLFGGIAAFLLALNALGKQIRARSILDNFQMTSAGIDHSAAYVLGSEEDLAHNITRGLEEGQPALLVSRPTALVKGFMRQSFSPRKSDGIGRILGWVLFGSALLAAVVTYWQTRQLVAAVSAFAALLCLGAPLTSSIVSGLPSLLLQRSASRVGAVVPGWSAVEELGEVNVVMAGARDLFPPTAISLHGLRAYQMQNINNAILYAASIVVEGCDTLRDIFMALINSKPDSLYKVESLTVEPGRGFTAWVDSQRVVLGTREMLQKHDIDPPAIEEEMKYANGIDKKPLYLAVSGTLYGMFVIGYAPDEMVQETLDGLVKSGVSLLVTSNDMNITSELVEEIYQLPQGLVKVLGAKELEMLEPLTNYLDESEGVMSHIGSFASFIGGMRAAAGCAAAEGMGSTLQIVSVVFACLLGLVLAFFGGLAGISVFPVILFQLAWSLVAVAIPFGRRG
ncbi:MAG: hypothetical protein ACK5L3_15155 [Oscillospiraceae bacterium]